MTHAWFPPNDDSPEPGLNPVAAYQIFFGNRSWPFVPQADGSGSKVPIVRLCPGAIIRVAKPVEIRRARYEVEVPGVRLVDLARSD